jgi:hypothetical protein
VWREVLWFTLVRHAEALEEKDRCRLRRVSHDAQAAFYTSRKDIVKKWNNIPRSIDVLITCQPPIGENERCIEIHHVASLIEGHGDADYNAEHLGDVDLLGKRQVASSQ